MLFELIALIEFIIIGIMIVKLNQYSIIVNTMQKLPQYGSWL